MVDNVGFVLTSSTDADRLDNLQHDHNYGRDLTSGGGDAEEVEDTPADGNGGGQNVEVQIPNGA